MTAIRIDSVAQQVEHNTFNVGVLGSSPSWITERIRELQQVTLFFYVQLADLPCSCRSRCKSVLLSLLQEIRQRRY